MDQKKAPALYQGQHLPSDILAPLQDVFLSRENMDAALRVFAVPELVRQQPLRNYGGIIMGRGGVGKTHFMKRLAQVYENAGAYIGEHTTSDVSTQYVSSRGTLTEAVLTEAAVKGRERRIPSLVWFDEATSLVLQRSATSNHAWGLEGIEALKAYVGNKRYLVVGFTTNETHSEQFEPNLLRPGRLTAVKFDMPEAAEREKIWAHYLKAAGIDYNEEGLSRFVAATEYESGAFIAHFCKQYSHSVEETSVLDKLLSEDTAEPFVVERKLHVFQLTNSLRAKVRESREARRARGEFLQEK